jgi:hypothetical protein
MDVKLLSLALGSSWASGINLYLTILVLGLLDRYDVIALPGKLHALSHPIVLIVALILFLIEFVADKIPYVDNAWDAIHTFIRVPAGALLAAASFTDVPAHMQVIAALLGGTVALTAHSTKASARLAVNTSPEPFSNWIISLLEDGLSALVVWLAVTHPLIAIALVLLFLFLSLWLISKLMKFVQALFKKVAHMFAVRE